jgi:N-methylhydantoinase A/oxoprolinase/acetone carboxylase beta subunit
VIVGCRVVGRGRLPQPEARAGEEGAVAEVAERSVVWASADGPVSLATTVVPAARASEVGTIVGPAIVEAATTTIVIPPGTSASADADGNLVLDVRGGGEDGTRTTGAGAGATS